MERQVERTPSSLAPNTSKPFEPEIPVGHPIKVYRNLRNRMWSIMDAKTRKVIGHAHNFLVGDCTFPVSAKGVERIRETGRKQVVAFVQGKFLGYGVDFSCQHSVRFNPYLDTNFVDAHGYPVKSAERVNFTGVGHSWALNLA